MNPIIKFFASYEWLFIINILTLLLLVFAQTGRQKTLNTGKALLKLIKDTEERIREFCKDPTLKEKNLAGLIGVLMEKIKFLTDSQKSSSDMIRGLNNKIDFKEQEISNYKHQLNNYMEELKIVKNKLIKEKAILKQVRKRNRKHCQSLYSQLAYRNDLLKKKGIVLIKKNSKYLIKKQ